jgi:hypothetical protein
MGWLVDMDIVVRSLDDGSTITILMSSMSDQAAVYSLPDSIKDLKLLLLSVRRMQDQE